MLFGGEVASCLAKYQKPALPLRKLCVGQCKDLYWAVRFLHRTAMQSIPRATLTLIRLPVQLRRSRHESVSTRLLCANALFSFSASISAKISLSEATYSADSSERLYVHVLLPRDGMRWPPAKEALFLPITEARHFGLTSDARQGAGRPARASE